MEEIKSKKSKQVTFRNEIIVGDKVVVGQSATIDTANPENIATSEYTNDKTLYKEHRQEIRELKAQFEDECFDEQDKMIDELGGNA